MTRIGSAAHDGLALSATLRRMPFHNGRKIPFCRTVHSTILSSGKKIPLRFCATPHRRDGGRRDGRTSPGRVRRAPFVAPMALLITRLRNAAPCGAFTTQREDGNHEPMPGSLFYHRSLRDAAPQHGSACGGGITGSRGPGPGSGPARRTTPPSPPRTGRRAAPRFALPAKI